MKKILGLSIAAFLIIAIVGGGTWAYFSDTQGSTGNTLIAGTLDVGLANTNTMATTNTTATWTSTNWAPGQAASGTLYISNNGTLLVNALTVAFDYGTIDTANRPTNISGSPWNLDTDKFDKMITATTATYDSVTVAGIQGKTLEELKAAGPISLGTLASGATKPLAITFTSNTTATNGCQGNTVDVTVTVTGTQN
jgi:spore coat-associated protein N